MKAAVLFMLGSVALDVAIPGLTMKRRMLLLVGIGLIAAGMAA